MINKEVKIKFRKLFNFFFILNRQFKFITYDNESIVNVRKQQNGVFDNCFWFIFTMMLLLN